MARERSLSAEIVECARDRIQELGRKKSSSVQGTEYKNWVEKNRGLCKGQNARTRSKKIGECASVSTLELPAVNSVGEMQ
ncbi:hypothetical protein AVEN_49889-1 [Araneus ventricosus]|uniref:Uncharacterized protein n=1 Tax=Araneus ventricosus TaxID=182803 RepID=A0A4Y2SUK9_ARAVE|nr:hypothetical protein AVEN_49889-1 [Araneus ventricosus]